MATKKIRIRKRGRTFSYAFEAGRKADGKRNTVEKGGFNTESAAYEAGVDAFNRHIHGDLSVSSNRIPLTDYVEKWLDGIHAQDVSPLTYRENKKRFERQIKTFFSGTCLQDVRPADIDRWIRHLVRQGFGYHTICGYKAVLSGALQYAVYPAELINGNPCAYIKIPKKAPTDIVKRTVISPAMYKELITEHFPAGHPMHMPVVIAYNTGMRLGEFLGLTWDRVDFDKGVIHITKQLNRLNGSKAARNYLYYIPPKHGSSRTIAMPTCLKRELSAYKLQQDKNKKLYGGAWAVTVLNPSTLGTYQISKDLLQGGEVLLDIVCTKADGLNVSRSWCNAQLHKFGLNSHSFRHTHATLLLESGAPTKGITNRLGHTSYRMTAKYTHATKKMDDDTLTVLESLTNQD